MADERGSFIYIVDDDAAVRESLEVLLESMDFDAQIKTYDNGVTFLDDLEGAASGCVLLDVRMPDLSGLEVQSALRDRGSNLAVIIITGHGDVAMAVGALRAGAYHFIEKPFTDGALAKLLPEAMAWSESAQKDSLTRQKAAERLSRITPRERDVLEQLVVGHPNKVIAYELGISARTVEVHRARLMEKLEVQSLSELVRLAMIAES